MELKGGQVDLSGQTFERSVRFQGQTRALIGELANPSDILKNPEMGSLQSLNTKLPGARPMGSFMIRLKNLDPKGRGLGLHLRADSAYRLYLLDLKEGRVNGIGSWGTVAAQKGRERPQLGTGLFRLPIPSQGAGDYILLIHVSNFHFSAGGIWENPEIGVYHQMQKQHMAESHSQVAVIAMCFIMGLYNLFIHFRRRDDLSTLFLAAFCLLQSFRLFAMSFLLGDLLPNMTSSQYEFFRRMEFLPFNLSVAAFVSFAQNNYRRYIKLSVSIGVWVFAAVYSLVVLGSSAKFYRPILEYTNPVLVLVALYAVFGIIRAAKDGFVGAITLAMGILVVIAASFVDLAVTMGLLSVPFIMGYGIVGLILAQGFVVAKLFASAYERTIHLNQQLKEQEEARTLFFHNVSHELRTPLNGIIGFSKLVVEGGYGTVSDKVKEQVGKIERLAQSLMLQVNTILDIAKSRRGQMELRSSIISLNELVNDTKSLGEGLTHKYDTASFEIETSWNWNESTSFVTDKEKAFAIIRNLIGNAFKFAKSGQPNQVRVSFALDAAHAFHIEVSDTGLGIPEESVPHIFEEFKQVDQGARRSFEGTGLGLAMVKEILKLMGGDIRVTSKPGEGSTFKVIIPENNKVVLQTTSQEIDEVKTVVSGLEEPSEDTHHLEMIARLEKHNDGQVFIIDDNDVNCEVQADILRNCGFHVRYATNGYEGIRMMEIDPPDVLLLDLMMPNFSGEDVLRNVKLHQRLREVPVILLTARASKGDMLHGLDIGADDYLPKPVDSQELILRVHNLLERQKTSKHSGEREALEAAQAMFAPVNPAVPQPPGFELSHYFKAASDMSRDWSRVAYHADSNELFLFMGDVGASGINASFITVGAAAACRAALDIVKQAGASIGLSQKLILLAKAINEALIDGNQDVRRYMSVAIVGLDIKTGQGWYLNAGHHGVFLHSGEGDTLLSKPGDPLGVTSKPQFGILDFQMTHRDYLMIYTDGLMENRGPEGRKLTIGDIKDSLAEGGSAETMKEHLLERANSLWRNRKGNDDYAFFILQCVQQLQSRRLDKTD